MFGPKDAVPVLYTVGLQKPSFTLRIKIREVSHCQLFLKIWEKKSLFLHFILFNFLVRTLQYSFFKVEKIILKKMLWNTQNKFHPDLPKWLLQTHLFSKFGLSDQLYKKLGMLYFISAVQTISWLPSFIHFGQSCSHSSWNQDSTKKLDFTESLEIMWNCHILRYNSAHKFYVSLTLCKHRIFMNKCQGKDRRYFFLN